MACICEICGKPNDNCEFRVCTRCWLEMTDDDAIKNLVLGGRFYPSVKKEVSNDKVDIKEVAANSIR